MSRKRNRTMRVLAGLLTLAMLLGVSQAGALDITTIVGQQVMTDGSPLTVKSGGSVEATATDANVSAVLGDVQTGLTSHWPQTPVYGVTNGTITVESGGAIKAAGAVTTSAIEDIYIRAIEADGAGTSNVNITNSGTISAGVTSVDDYAAHALAIQVFHDVNWDEVNTSTINIDNLGTGVIEAAAVNSGTGGAAARGIQTCDYKTGLDINNAGKITATATTSDDTANAEAIKLGYDNGGTITNSGTVKATATALGDDTAEARGIHVGGDDESTTGNVVNIVNAAGGTISGIGIATEGGNAVAWGIHAGGDIVGTVTNSGTISAKVDADTGYTHAFAIHTGGDMALDNYGAITADVTLSSTQDYDGIYESRATGVFAADGDYDGDGNWTVDINNAKGASITATATMSATGVDSYMYQNPGAQGIKLADGYIYNGTADSTKAFSRTVTNDGSISATSTLSATDYISDNPGSQGIKAGYTYTYNSGSGSTLTSTLDLVNNGTITADTTITTGEYLSDNAGAFGMFAGETIAYNYDSSTGTSISNAATNLTNTGTITSSAVIKTGYTDDPSGAYGIKTGQTYAYDAYNASATNTASAITTITNLGMIKATATVESTDPVSGYLYQNTGSYGIRTGEVYTSGYDDTARIIINNGGTIESTATLTAPEMGVFTGAFGIRTGMDADYAGDGNYILNVTNGGSINATATINTDFVDGSDYNRGAFGIRTGTAKVVNTGSIAATATMNGLNDSAYDGAYGIRTGDGSATVVHSGAITANLTDNDASTLQRAVGIMTGQSDNQIHLSGSITATATGGDAYSIVMGCENSGGSNNTLYIMNGASLTGDVLNAGDSLAEATLGSLKDANGMAAAGLAADTSFFFDSNSDFIGVNDGGDDWNVTLKGGTLAGDIYIDGNYTQEAASTYLARVGSLAPTLLAVSNTATLADGAILGVEASGYVADGTYTVISAATLTGFYAADPVDSMVLDYTLVNDADNTVKVAIARTPYAALPISANQATLAGALVNEAIAGSMPASEYLNIVDNCSTAECLGEALGAVSPEQYPNLLDVSMAGSLLYRSTVAARMGDVHLTKAGQSSETASNTMTTGGPALTRLPAFERTAGGWNGWVRVIGATGDQDSDKGIDGYEFDTSGVSLGFDNQVSDNLALGLGFGISSSDVDYDTNGREADVWSNHVALYGTYSTPQFYIDSAIQYAASEYDSERVNTTLNENITSDTDGEEFGIYVGGGYNLVDDTDWFFIPTASVEWAKAEIDGFDEEGSTLGLHVDDFDADSLVTSLGFRLGANLAMGETKIVPELRLAWAHEFGDTERDVKANFLGTASTFTIDGIEPDEDSALVGVGINAYVRKDISFFVDYEGEFRSDFDGHAISGGLRYSF